MSFPCHGPSDRQTCTALVVTPATQADIDKFDPQGAYKLSLRNICRECLKAKVTKAIIQDDSDSEAEEPEVVEVQPRKRRRVPRILMSEDPSVKFVELPLAMRDRITTDMSSDDVWDLIKDFTRPGYSNNYTGEEELIDDQAMMQMVMGEDRVAMAAIGVDYHKNVMDFIARKMVEETKVKVAEGDERSRKYEADAKVRVAEGDERSRKYEADAKVRVSKAEADAKLLETLAGSGPIPEDVRQAIFKRLMDDQ